MYSMAEANPYSAYTIFTVSLYYSPTDGKVQYRNLGSCSEVLETESQFCLRLTFVPDTQLQPTQDAVKQGLP